MPVDRIDDRMIVSFTATSAPSTTTRSGTTIPAVPSTTTRRGSTISPKVRTPEKRTSGNAPRSEEVQLLEAA